MGSDKKWRTATNTSSKEKSISPSTPNPDDEVELDATESSDNGTIESYEWDLDGDGEFGEHGENGATVEYTFDEEDAHFVRLRVSDNGRKSDTVKRRLFVGNKRPTVGFEFSPETPKPGQTVSLDASQSTDPDGVRARFEGVAPVHEIGSPTTDGRLEIDVDGTALDYRAAELREKRDVIESELG